jgi:hypothetical protein
LVAEDLRLFVKTVLNFHVVATVLLEGKSRVQELSE